MRLSTKSRYAVMAMADLAKTTHATPVSLAAISQRQDLPLPYLEQLFNKLKKAGLVISSRGSNGGYSLSRLPVEIAVSDIIMAVDTPLKATRCSSINNDQGCQRTGERCLTHDLWDELGAVVHLFLNQVTLEDICQRRVLGMGRFRMTAPFKQEGKVA